MTNTLTILIQEAETGPARDFKVEDLRPDVWSAHTGLERQQLGRHFSDEVKAGRVRGVLRVGTRPGGFEAIYRKS